MIYMCSSNKSNTRAKSFLPCKPFIAVHWCDCFLTLPTVVSQCGGIIGMTLYIRLFLCLSHFWGFHLFSEKNTQVIDLELSGYIHCGMHKAWHGIEEVLYCFPRSYIKFHGHTGQKITNFDPNWVILDCSSSLNPHMDFNWNDAQSLMY